MILSRFLVFILVSMLFLAGCGRDTETHEDLRTRVVDSELIREEGTNVATLDANNDGTVYQCPMDYQVIADSLDTCPVCKMDLEEYTVAEAQKNLEEHYRQQ